MSLRSSLWIAAAAAGCMIAPASAQPPSGNQHTYTQSYLFPAISLGTTETARISIVNIAPASKNGMQASCSGSILFTNLTGTQVGPAIPFKNVGTRQIFVGELPGASPSGPPSPTASNIPGAIQGEVDVTINKAAYTPCSLLLTLETYDTSTGAAHAVLTVAVAAPEAVETQGWRH